MNKYESLQAMGYTTHQIIRAIQIVSSAMEKVHPGYYDQDKFAPPDWAVLAVLKASEG